ncbi:MAG: hypothetical protein IJT59_05760 [Desulfovibrionaceae bacterium]|nr:hypothetical protein [Desulfovibrionaceae bacterium]
MQNDIIFNKLLNKINVGKAILFVGAGFSKDSINVSDNNLPLAKELSIQISNLGQFGQSEDLKYTSNRYFIEHQDDKKGLLD